MRRRLLVYLPSIVLCFLALLPLPGSEGKPGLAQGSAQPKLVVVIIIDQFRNDYLVRFQPHFVERGFNLLLGGANFINCRYNYAVTSTGPGHATLMTGAYSNVHGIVENEWYDRHQRRPVYCVEDPTARLVETAEGASEQLGASPQLLLGSTLGDELRLASEFQSKVIAISLKDRGAVLAGGHTANAAYWYKSSSGRFVSSTYYMSALPEWAAKFNELSPAKDYCGKPWQALPETPGAEGKVFRKFDASPSETCPDNRFLEWINRTPFMDEIELRFAREAVRSERLGQGPATDLLTISLSANDYIGHEFGPYSPQLADLTLRTDRYLSDFFSDLDRMVGLQNVWIALSADHGVAPTPRFVKEHRLGMGQFQVSAVGKAIVDALSQAFGREQWALDIGLPCVYLNQAALKRRQIDPEKAEAEAVRAVETVPGVRVAFTRSQILGGDYGQSPLGRKVLNSYEPQRSGDLFLILDPYAVPSAGETDTTHGSLWNYDAQVPLLLWGDPFRPGVYPEACETIDLAPTLAVALGLNQPSGAQGQPLTKALNLR